MDRTRNRFKILALLALTAAGINAHAAAITVRDDDGNVITLQKPAQRIVSMSPHVTELLFAAGGGDRIVGAVTYSDFPEAAKKIPRIGTNRQIDMERVITFTDPWSDQFGSGYQLTQALIAFGRGEWFVRSMRLVEHHHHCRRLARRSQG